MTTLSANQGDGFRPDAVKAARIVVLMRMRSAISAVLHEMEIDEEISADACAEARKAFNKLQALMETEA